MIASTWDEQCLRFSSAIPWSKKWLFDPRQHTSVVSLPFCNWQEKTRRNNFALYISLRIASSYHTFNSWSSANGRNLRRLITMQPMLTSPRENSLFVLLYCVSRVYSLICLEGIVKSVWRIIRWQPGDYQSGKNRRDADSVTMQNCSVATSFACPVELSLRNFFFFSQLIKVTDSNPEWSFWN